jgi:hypothetical protein
VGQSQLVRAQLMQAEAAARIRTAPARRRIKGLQADYEPVTIAIGRTMDDKVAYVEGTADGLSRRPTRRPSRRGRATSG